MHTGQAQRLPIRAMSQPFRYDPRFPAHLLAAAEDRLRQQIFQSYRRQPSGVQAEEEPDSSEDDSSDGDDGVPTLDNARTTTHDVCRGTASNSASPEDHRLDDGHQQEHVEEGRREAVREVLEGAEDIGKEPGDQADFAGCRVVLWEDTWRSQEDLGLKQEYIAVRAITAVIIGYAVHR